MAFVWVDAPPGEHFSIMPSDLDAVTTNELAYLRLHGRNTEGYLKGKSVAERFGWRYEDDELEEIAGRAHGDGRAGGRGARGVQQQPRRRRPDRRAALPRAAGSGAGRRGAAQALSGARRAAARTRPGWRRPAG